MPCLSNVESFLISSDLIASQLLLEIAHCIPLSPQSVSSHLISTHLISCLLSFSQLFSADHNCSHLFSCHLSFSHFLPAHLNSSLFSSSQLLHSTQLVSTQFFSALHRSSHVRSSQLTPSHLISAFLRSSTLLSSCQLISYIFSAHLSSSQLLSALLTSAQLSSAHSQIISTLVRPKTCSKTRFRRQSRKKYFRSFGKGISKGKCKVPKSRKIIKQLIVATLAQPFHQRFCHLYKEDCMDTLGIRMQLTWILQPQHGGLHGYARIHMDPSISTSRIARVP